MSVITNNNYGVSKSHQFKGEVRSKGDKNFLHFSAFKDAVGYDIEFKNISKEEAKNSNLDSKDWTHVVYRNENDELCEGFLKVDGLMSKLRLKPREILDNEEDRVCENIRNHVRLYQKFGLKHEHFQLFDQFFQTEEFQDAKSLKSGNFKKDHKFTHLSEDKTLPFSVKLDPNGVYIILKEFTPGSYKAGAAVLNLNLGRVEAHLQAKKMMNTKDRIQWGKEMAVLNDFKEKPEICQLVKFTNINGKYGFVMKYYPTDLKELLKKGDLEVEQACELAINIGTGMRTMHEASYTHRDIKPANIFIDIDGKAVLGDMGFTANHLMDDNEWTDDFHRGTPAFMHPKIYINFKEEDLQTKYKGILKGMTIEQKLNFQMLTNEIKKRIKYLKHLKSEVNKNIEKTRTEVEEFNRLNKKHDTPNFDKKKWLKQREKAVSQKKHTKKLRALYFKEEEKTRIYLEDLQYQVNIEVATNNCDDLYGMLEDPYFMIGQKLDMYSFGRCILEMACGKPLKAQVYKAPTQEEMLRIYPELNDRNLTSLKGALLNLAYVLMNPESIADIPLADDVVEYLETIKNLAAEGATSFPEPPKADDV